MHYTCKACGADAWIGHKRPQKGVTYGGRMHERQLCEKCGKYALAADNEQE